MVAIKTEFDYLMEQVSDDLYSASSPLVAEQVSVFRPSAYVVGQVIRPVDYNFVLPTSDVPAVRIGKLYHRFPKNSLAVIGPDVEYYCDVNWPTREYISGFIKKDFFEHIAAEAIGRPRPDFTKGVYPSSPELIRLIVDLRNELACYGGECGIMVRSIAAQIVVQLLRDTGEYTSGKVIRPRLSLRYNSSRDTLGEEKLVEGHGPGLGDLPIGLTETSWVSLALVRKANCSLSKPHRLTAREVEIASYLVNRFDYDTIAERLLITRNTVKTHVKRIYDKLTISRRKQLEARIAELVGDSVGDAPKVAEV